MRNRNRRDLSLLVVLLVFLFAAIAVPVPSALPIFDKVLPAMMLVLGYHFGSVR